MISYQNTQFNRDKHKRFGTFMGHSFHTLPSNDRSKFGSSNSYIAGVYHKDAWHSNGVATSIGAFYNATAYSAGTATSSVTSGNLTYDICPKQWQIPTLDQQKSILSYTSDYTIVMAGLVGGSYGDYGASSNKYTNKYGFWWSRSVNSSSQMKDMGYTKSTGKLTTGTTARYYGESVRCLAK